uniref:hypothetical protein n=1 Tax=Thaumasiovibrio occultus TaxID=1891184 RepID=UPI000B35F345|nr:hypothetical protein [Thaumasiovibrio occultus]
MKKVLFTLLFSGIATAANVGVTEVQRAAQQALKHNDAERYAYCEKAAKVFKDVTIIAVTDFTFDEVMCTGVNPQGFEFEFTAFKH